jgi:hypothetical protein
MHIQRSIQAVVQYSLAPLFVLLAIGCTPSVKVAHKQTVPLLLSNPASISSGSVSLAVGTNRWSKQDSGLEEAFLPVAVTVRNSGDRTLCGGASTAVLGDSSGASVSATLPEGVVTRLFGPLASLEPMSQPAVGSVALSDQDVFLSLVHDSHGIYSGGMGYRGGGFPGGALRPPYLRPSPRIFVPPLFSSPFSSFYPSPFSPFYSPVPPLSSYGHTPYGYTPYGYTPYGYTPYGYTPYGYAPYGYAPYEYSYTPPSLPPPSLPDLRLPEENRSTVDSSLIKEILSAAFASRPLTPQEERSGFLFFPLPVPDGGATMLTWGWYDCATHELVAHLSILVPVEKKV